MKMSNINSEAIKQLEKNISNTIFDINFLNYFGELNFNNKGKMSKVY